MIDLCELFPPRPEPGWRLVKQCGVDSVVALLNGGEQDQRMFASVGGGRTEAAVEGPPPWSEQALRRDVAIFARHGFDVACIEDTAPIDRARLGLSGRDEQIAHVIEQIEAMGRLGIPVLCYNWMAVSSWSRTSVEGEGRGGALVTGFSVADAARLPALAEPGEITAEQLWAGLTYFLEAVVPVAERAGVRLAMHPDDPPIPEVRNVPRIMSSPDAFRRLLGIVDSPSNSVTLCQGNFTLMTEDLPGLIRELGARERIAFVHFRDVRGTADDFVEVFHDEGPTDMLACMRAYAEVGFEGPLRPDHVPTMEGEGNERPAYGLLGRLYALGYVRGLAEAAY